MSFRITPSAVASSYGLLRIMMCCLLVCLSACSPKPANPPDTLSSLQAALVRAGWKDVSTMHVQSDSYSTAGIIEAGLINDGHRRLEVYRVGVPENASPVAGIFSSSGDPVFTCGVLVVVIPSGTGDEDASRMLQSLGFNRVGSAGQ